MYFDVFEAISDIETGLSLSGFEQLKPMASLFATSGPTRTSPLVILSTKPAHPINKRCKKKQPTNLERQLFFLFKLKRDSTVDGTSSVCKLLQSLRLRFSNFEPLAPEFAEDVLLEPALRDD